LAINQEDELSLEDEVMEMRKRMERLEKEVKEVSEPLQKTLLDIRSMLSELENPFNYLKFMGYETPPAPTPKTDEANARVLQKREVTDEKPANKPFKEAVQKAPPSEKAGSPSKNYRTPLNFYNSPIPMFACATYLILTFGKDGLLDLLKRYGEEGWIPEEVEKSIRKTVEIIFGKVGEKPLEAPLNNRMPLSVEDYLIALLLLNKLAEYEEDDTTFLILLLILNKMVGPIFRKASSPFKEIEDRLKRYEG